jgi:hypothetical protein
MYLSLLVIFVVGPLGGRPTPLINTFKMSSAFSVIYVIMF